MVVVNLCIRHHIMFPFKNAVQALAKKRECNEKSDESEPICLFKMQKVNKISIK